MRKINRTTKLITITMTAGIAVICAFFFIEHYVKLSLDKTINISHDSGFYEGEFDVEISVGKNYFLTYTLDGTNPSIDSPRYDGPIHIKDASQNENVFSSIKEVSAKYYDETMDYTIPSENVDKCTLLRVCAFDYSGNKVSGALREYFVDFDNKKGYDGLYAVCVSTDPDYLFSDSVGIYVLGEGFREMIDSGEVYSYDWRHGWAKQREANWFKSGPLFERVCTVEILNPNRELIMSTNCGMRVRGHDSRHWPQKSIGLYAREEYNENGKNRFDYDFFGDGIGPSNLILFNCGDDCDVKLVDYTIFNALATGENEFTVADLIPCNVFLNGEYWGPMYIMQDLNASYLATEYGVSKDNVRLIKSGEFKGNEAVAEYSTDVDDWNELVEYILDNDMSDDKCYEYVCSQIDMENFVDYFATELYIGNNNWRPDNNFACWRTAKTEHGNKYADGRWRFCLFDVNDAYRGDTHIERGFQRMLEWNPIIKSLAENKEFESMFKARMDELVVMFSEENIDSIITEWQKVMEEPVECYYKRFCDKPGVENQTEERIAYIKNFCKKRPEQLEILYGMLFG